jgi:hypothetical protein
LIMRFLGMSAQLLPKYTRGFQGAGYSPRKW